MSAADASAVQSGQCHHCNGVVRPPNPVSGAARLLGPQAPRRVGGCGSGVELRRHVRENGCLTHMQVPGQTWKHLTTKRVHGVAIRFEGRLPQAPADNAINGAHAMLPRSHTTVPARARSMLNRFGPTRPILVLFLLLDRSGGYSAPLGGDHSPGALPL